MNAIEIPEFFYSIVFSNFQDKNEKHGLNTDELLATKPIGLETARTIKKWQRLTRSANQRLANARAKYAAERSATNANEFSRISIDVASIPSSLYSCLQMAKARDETNKRRAEAKRVYKAARSSAYGAYYAARNEAQGFYRRDRGRQSSKNDCAEELEAIENELKERLEKASDAYQMACIRAFVVSEDLIL
jgi:hypothetical protein